MSICRYIVEVECKFPGDRWFRIERRYARKFIGFPGSQSAVGDLQKKIIDIGCTTSYTVTPIGGMTYGNYQDRNID